MAFALNSPSFPDGSAIPGRHAADGANMSPPLEWSDPPPKTQSFCLVVEDPDAPSGTFRHWAVYDIPADRRRLDEGAGSASAALPQGVNDFRHARYDGPRPPAGHGRHHYHFRLAAISVPHLEVRQGATAAEVWKAAGPFMLGQAELVGTYER